MVLGHLWPFGCTRGLRTSAPVVPPQDRHEDPLQQVPPPLAQGQDRRVSSVSPCGERASTTVPSRLRGGGGQTRGAAACGGAEPIGPEAPQPAHGGAIEVRAVDGGEQVSLKAGPGAWAKLKESDRLSSAQCNSTPTNSCTVINCRVYCTIISPNYNKG